jgi:putative ATP-binding cassette transporter
MSLFLFLLRSSRGVVLLSVAAGVISGACGVALIALIQTELARAGGAPGRLVWAFAGLCVVGSLARVSAQAAMARLGQGTVGTLSLHLCRKILALPLERFEASDPDGLLAVLTEDIVVIANALTGVPLVCIHGPLVAACLAYVGWLSPAVLVCGGAAAALGVVVFLALSARAMRYLHAARAGQDALVGHFRALIDGFRELKVHRPRREALLTEALEPAADLVRVRNSAGLALYAVAEGWGQLALFSFLGLVVFALPGALGLSRPTLAAAVMVVLYVMTPLDVILTWVPNLGRARASLLRVEALIPALDATGPVERENLSPLDPPRDALELEGVRFTYPPEEGAEPFALGPLSLTLRPGELVFLAGGNGSGKTTLVKLLTGLYTPQSGTIRLDGRPVGPGEREAYRQLFSVVFADGFLFRDLLGLDRNGLDERASDGLERLGLGGRVRVEGGSFSTVDLSQGQRRRLALLTALLEDRPVCVFDEWAANQDARFKKLFYRELLPGLKAAGKAVLVISHDEDYYDDADRVVRLRDGRAVDGPPGARTAAARNGVRAGPAGTAAGVTP